MWLTGDKMMALLEHPNGMTTTRRPLLPTLSKISKVKRSGAVPCVKAHRWWAPDANQICCVCPARERVQHLSIYHRKKTDIYKITNACQETGFLFMFKNNKYTFAGHVQTDDQALYGWVSFECRIYAPEKQHGPINLQPELSLCCLSHSVRCKAC